MALAKDQALNDSGMCLNHVYPYYESDHFGGSSSVQGLSDQSSPGLYEEQQKKLVFEEGDSSSKNFAMSSSSSHSSPSSANSSGLGYHQQLKYQVDDCNSVISFNSGYANSIGSLLSFEQNVQFPENLSIWDNNVHLNYQNQLTSKPCDPKPHQLPENSSRSVNPQTATTSGIKDFGRAGACINKRPYMEESNQPFKKQCTGAEKQVKPQTSPSKDPQSIAAKNRRERISERLKILQELVPNGSKVDLVTMLEKAISYVKFLQLQVKVLATDEFWPAQGGKAPDLSQVKEAIDAILASQRNKNSSSK